MKKNKEQMTFLSECKFCKKWIRDPEGNSYWTHDPLEKHVTYIICDDCKQDEVMFKIIEKYMQGIVYDNPNGERYVWWCVEELIKKHGPKSEYRYTYLEIDLNRAWEAEEIFHVKDNAPKWDARDGNDVKK